MSRHGVCIFGRDGSAADEDDAASDQDAGAQSGCDDEAREHRVWIVGFSKQIAGTRMKCASVLRQPHAALRN